MSAELANSAEPTSKISVPNTIKISEKKGPLAEWMVEWMVEALDRIETQEDLNTLPIGLLGSSAGAAAAPVAATGAPE